MRGVREVRSQNVLALIAALAFSLMCDVSAQNTSAPDVVGVGNFSHIVRDMERAVVFYRDCRIRERRSCKSAFATLMHW